MHERQVKKRGFISLKKVLSNLILVLVCLAVPLGALELYGWFYVKQYSQYKNSTTNIHQYSQYRNHELNPSPDVFKPGTGMHHSPDGFKRDTPVSLEKPANTLRILMMGASALYGLGISGPYPPHQGLKNSELVDRVVEEKLNQELAAQGISTKVEIVNSAVSGYTSLQQLCYFMESLYGYNFDMVVFFDGYNDLFVQKKDFRQFKDQPFFGGRVAEHINNRSPVFTFYLMSRLFSKYSYAARMLELKLFAKLIEFENIASLERGKQHMSLEEAPLEYKKNAYNSFMRAYELFDSLARRYDFKMYYFLQPMINFEDDKLLSEQDKNLKQITLKHYTDYKYDVKIFDVMRSMLPGMFKEIGVSYKDMAQIASPETKSEQLYIDYCHLSPEGAKRAGEMLSRDLLPEVTKLIRERQNGCDCR